MKHNIISTFVIAVLSLIIAGCTAPALVPSQILHGSGTATAGSTQAPITPVSIPTPALHASPTPSATKVPLTTVCEDTNGSLKKTSSFYVLDQAGSLQILDTVSGTVNFENPLGVDWYLLRKCRVVVLYNVAHGSSEIYVLFAPEGFPMERVWEKPFNGAKKVTVTQGEGHLEIIGEDGTKISN